MSGSMSLQVTYDSDSDVLYIVTKKERATKGIEDSQGIVWRFGPHGDVIGVTIVDYRDLWSGRQDELAGTLAHRLHVSQKELKGVLAI